MTTFTAIDFETADYGRDSACAVATVTVNSERIVHRYTQLIRPPRQNFVFTHIHGISWVDVASSPVFADIWPNLEEIINRSDFLVAHNAPFDKGVLNKCCEAAGIPSPGIRFGCTLKVARATWGLPSSKLNLVCEHLNIPLKHHDAASDAEACARITIAAMKKGVSV